MSASCKLKTTLVDICYFFIASNSSLSSTSLLNCLLLGAKLYLRGSTILHLPVGAATTSTVIYIEQLVLLVDNLPLIFQPESCIQFLKYDFYVPMICLTRSMCVHKLNS